MRIYIMLIMLFIFTSCSEETSKRKNDDKPTLRSDIEDSIAIKQKALKDCSEGKLKLYFIGMLNDRSHYYGEYLQNKKGIKVEFTGCIVFPEHEITNRIMEECIKAKYGNDFFEKAEKEAVREYHRASKLKVEH